MFTIRELNKNMCLKLEGVWCLTGEKITKALPSLDISWVGKMFEFQQDKKQQKQTYITYKEKVFFLL